MLFFNALTKNIDIFTKNYTGKTVADRPLGVAQWPAVGPNSQSEGDESQQLQWLCQKTSSLATDCQGFLDMVVVKPSETSSSTLPLPQSQLGWVYLVRSGIFRNFVHVSNTASYEAELHRNCRNVSDITLLTLIGTYSYQ